MTKYIIENITYHSGKTRTDDGYPERIGSTVIMQTPTNDYSLILIYIKDNVGNDVEGKYIRTSAVIDYNYYPRKKLYVVKTLNSVFYLRECE